MAEPEPELEEHVNQPGLAALREAVKNIPSPFARGGELGKDAIAGLSTAVANVPDGLANALLVGVNPLHGLYATMAGPIGGGLLSSTRLMVITTTAAASLTAGQALAGYPAEARAAAMAAMVVLIGLFQMLFGLLRFGRLTRFVSYSVMTGLLSGVSALLILSQVPTLTGADSTAVGKVAQAFDVLTHPGRVEIWSLVIGGFALVLAVLLPRTRLGSAGRLLAIVVPSLLVLLLGGGVAVVGDVATIEGGVPLPSLPNFAGLSVDIVTGALAVALVILVQGAGVSQSVPNRDGSARSTSRDFFAQGGANLLSGLFRGLPVGGSLSATALNLLSGARSRLSVILAGAFMVVIVIVFPTLVAFVAMPTLGALLIIAGLSSLRFDDLAAVRAAGWASVLAAITTFFATLFLPIQAAVGIGVVLSALLYIIRSSADVTLVRLVKRDDGRIEERRPPEHLVDDDVTVLDAYGDLFYAGARTLERLLPEPRLSQRPVLVLRLRGHKRLGATLIQVLADYSQKLSAAGGRLYLSGLDDGVVSTLERSRKLSLGEEVKAFGLTPVLGQATDEAVEDARAWLVESYKDEPEDR